MSMLRLALRNLLRNRRRSLATALAMMIGCASVLMFGGYSADIGKTMHTAYVRAGGQLQVQHRDYLSYGSGDPARYGVAGYDGIIRAVRADPVLKEQVGVVTPVLQFGGMASNSDAGVSRTVLVNGIVASDRSVMGRWNAFGVRLLPDEMALDGSASDAAIVGLGVARVLHLCKALGMQDCAGPQPLAQPDQGAALEADLLLLAEGEHAQQAAGRAAGAAASRIDLLAGNPRGAPNVATLNVIQAKDQGFKELDEVYLITHFDQARKLVFGREAARATAIALQLHRSEDIEGVRERVQNLLPQVAPGQDLVVHDFMTLNPFYVQSRMMFDTIFNFIFVLIGGIVLFTVSNTMNAAIVERTSEIGTVRALGYRYAAVRNLFVLEGLLLGVAGATGGVLLALLGSWLVNLAGLTWLPPGAAGRLPLTVGVLSEWSMMVWTSLGICLVAVLSAWWPAHRAARMNIVDALRHV